MNTSAKTKDLNPVLGWRASSQVYKDVHEERRLIPPKETLMSQKKELVGVRTSQDAL